MKLRKSTDPGDLIWTLIEIELFNCILISKLSQYFVIFQIYSLVIGQCKKSQLK